MSFKNYSCNDNALRWGLVQYSSPPACLLDQHLRKPFRLAYEWRVPHIMPDDIIDPVLPARLRCVNEVLDGRYGAGLVAHAEDISCGNCTPCSIGSRAPVISVRPHIHG